MKIFVFTSLYAPYARGGAEVVATRIVEGLRTSHEVTVVTARPFKGLSSLFPHEEKQGNQRVLSFTPLNIFSFVHIERYPFFLRTVWHLLDMVNVHTYFTIKRLLQQEQPDVVLSHTIKGLGYTSLRAVTSAGIPLVHTVHDIQYLVPSGILATSQSRLLERPTLLMKLYRVVTRWLLGSPSVVLFPSRFLKRVYAGNYFFPRSKSIEMLNFAPLQPNEYHAKVTRHESCVFLFVGQLEPHKGPLYCAKSMMGLSEVFSMNFIGEGSCSEELKALAEQDPRIQVLGRLSQEEVRGHMRDADFLVVPSLCIENSPSVVYEALAVGTPVIAADSGGVAELVEDGANGFIFDASTENGCGDAIRRALSYERYKELSVHALETVRHHSQKDYLEKLEGIIQEVLPR